MLNKLVTVEKRFEEVNALLCTSDVASDMEKYTSLMKELKQLTPIVEKFREYKNAEASFNEAKEMLSAGGLDKDFKEMVEEEYRQSKEDMEVFIEELKILLLPKDPNDDRNVIVEIRQGAGGEEAALFAADLYRMYSMFTTKEGFKLELGEEFGTYASLSAEDSLRIIDFLTLFRSGPVMMSKAVEGMVESSYNLAVAKLEGTKFNAVVSFRSSEEASLDDLTLKMYSIGRVSGFSAVCRGRYPGWKYADVSPLRDAYLKAWKDLFGTEGIAIGIHAGLECGLLISRVPDMDIISIGPDIKDLHSPSESLGIGSFDRFYETVLKIIEIC